MNSKQRRQAKRRAFRQGQKKCIKIAAYNPNLIDEETRNKCNPYKWRAYGKRYERPKRPRVQFLEKQFNAGWDSAKP